VRKTFDELDEERLSSCPEFIAACLLIVRGLEESTIDWTKVKKGSWEEIIENAKKDNRGATKGK